MYLFSSILGIFVFDENINLIDEMQFNEISEYQNRKISIEKIMGRHKNIKAPDENTAKKILNHFKDKKYKVKFREMNLAITKLGIKNSVNEDTFIIQAIKSIGGIDRSINQLAKRLRDWYELYNPEISRSIKGHEEFVQKILQKEKFELLEELNEKNSMGADLEPKDLEPIKAFAKKVFELYKLKKLEIEYSSSLMDSYCPNLKAVCDVNIAAKLIEHAGSLKRLSMLPSSTIQILGAEKALFRHMKTGAKSPKHGIILGHPLMAPAPFKLHGKLARALSDKISIASKVDYFHGQFIGDKLRKGLEEKFGQ